MLHHSHYDVIYASRGAHSPRSHYDVILTMISFATELATPTVTDVMYTDTLPRLIYRDASGSCVYQEFSQTM